ncbi:TatD-related deoxyribonuclease [Arcobacter nitrofigilis DSM 7299]|uniref:TatD-related deoxyribonuclease n=1 Tax=Arcobacter nitrofigilis (strain ATCC 33309 / DSM 7299 / CCUG 15893 / LMG 7604 / NCTC 12251 / CI) TaxID=572480 RepID=D5V382_ARCNC|nr:TatD family hydrolase [Arcobacter nitrofigilis]ADG92664.1 TatD-related deoxyribonuclease [Arcobacter nitrofigilis DSM 7299]
MINGLIDTHCHINFFKNAGEVAIECEKRKIHTIYVTTLPSQFDETFEYVKPLKYVYPSLGFHCLESDYNLEKEKRFFLKNIEKTKFIGEVGLDFSKRASKSKEEQIDLFKFVLESIQDKEKIVNLHSNNAEEKVLEMLIKYDIKKAIFHWYSGKISTFNQILNYGYYFSINESMTKSKKGQNIISKMPRDRILIETDAPFIKDVLPYKNFNVYYYLSTIWNESIDYVIKKTFDNFINLQDNKKNNLFG